MAKRVVVTKAQRSAAKAMVQRSAVTGRYVSPSLKKIAGAKVVPKTSSNNSKSSSK